MAELAKLPPAAAALHLSEQRRTFPVLSANSFPYTLRALNAHAPHHAFDISLFCRSMRGTGQCPNDSLRASRHPGYLRWSSVVDCHSSRLRSSSNLHWSCCIQSYRPHCSRSTQSSTKYVIPDSVVQRRNEWVVHQAERGILRVLD